jgi:hypothetical protein
MIMMNIPKKDNDNDAEGDGNEDEDDELCAASPICQITIKRDPDVASSVGSDIHRTTSSQKHPL